MAEKDISSKNLEACNDVFADIVNFFIFNGRQVVKPEELQDTQLQNQFKFESKLHEEQRDVSKYWCKSKIRIAFLGLENQTQVDKDMPLRVMAYDGEAYKGQLLTKPYITAEERRYPVITLVLYFGEGHWQRPKSLYECIDVPQELREYINDYKIHVFELGQVKLEEVCKFKSDFKEIVDFLVHRDLADEYVPSTDEFKHPDEVLKMMTAITGNQDFLEEINNKQGRPKNMCQLTERLINKGMKQGLEQGRKEMQTKLDEAVARAKRAEEEAKQAEKEADDANSKLAKLKAYLNTMGINPDMVMEEQATYGK